MSKVDETEITGTEKQYYRSSDKNSGTVTVLNTPFRGNYRRVMSAFGIYASDAYYTVSAGSQSSGNKNSTASGTFTNIEKGVDIKRYYTNNLANATLEIYGTMKLTKNILKKEIPIEVKNLGEEITCILFGRLPNGDWYDGL